MHLVEMVGVSQDGNNGTRDDNGDRMVLGLARDVLHLPAFVDDESTTGDDGRCYEPNHLIECLACSISNFVVWRS